MTKQEFLKQADRLRENFGVNTLKPIKRDLWWKALQNHNYKDVEQTVDYVISNYKTLPSLNDFVDMAGGPKEGDAPNNKELFESGVRCFICNHTGTIDAFHESLITSYDDGKPVLDYTKAERTPYVDTFRCNCAFGEAYKNKLMPTWEFNKKVYLNKQHVKIIYGRKPAGTKMSAITFKLPRELKQQFIDKKVEYKDEWFF